MPNVFDYIIRQVREKIDGRKWIQAKQNHGVDFHLVSNSKTKRKKWKYWLKVVVSLTNVTGKTYQTTKCIDAKCFLKPDLKDHKTKQCMDLTNQIPSFSGGFRDWWVHSTKQIPRLVLSYYITTAHSALDLRPNNTI